MPVQKKASDVGGAHALRSNLFAAEPAKRISTAIVAAIQVHSMVIFLTAF